MIDLLQEPSFLWLLGLVAVAAIVFALRYQVLTRKTKEDAVSDWGYQVSENMQDLRLTKDAYMRAYTKVHAPRKAKYTAMALVAVLIFAVPSFVLIQSIVYGIWYMSGQSRVFEPPFLVYQFLVFFSTIVFWIFIMSRFIRHFYKHIPGIMRDELAYERAGYKPDRKLVVGPNPAHIDSDAFELTQIGSSKFGWEVYAEIFSDALGLSRETDKNWQGSGHACDIYSDGSDMKIFVHIEADGFTPKTHPFFYPGKHARKDDKLKTYTLIIRSPNAFAAFERIKASGFPIVKSSGSKTSRLCNIKADFLDIYIYDERWA